MYHTLSCSQICKTSNIGGLVHRDWGYFWDNSLLTSSALGLSGDKLGGDGLDIIDKGSRDDSLYSCLSVPDGT